MADVKKVIGAGAVRQVASGALLMGALGIAARHMSSVEFSTYNDRIILFYLLAAILGIPGYSTIYKFLASSREETIGLRFPIYLTGTLAVLSVLAGACLKFIAGTDFYDAIGLSAMVVAACLPALSLGLSRYRIFNIGELAPAITTLALVLLVRPHNAQELLRCFYLGFASKLLVYIYLAATYKNIWGSTEGWASRLKEGSIVGLSGAIQTSAFRWLYLASILAVSAPVGVLIGAAYPFVEKLLVLPQAANSIMFGRIVRDRPPLMALVKLYLLIFLVLSIGSFVVPYVLLLGERYYFGSGYAGISKYSRFLSLLFVLQGMRLMLHNYLQAWGRSVVVMCDSTLMALVALVFYLLFKTGTKVSDFQVFLTIFIFYILSISICFFAGRKCRNTV